MKKILYLVWSAAALSACGSTDKYTLSGEIEGLDAPTVYLVRSGDKSLEVIDSARVENGRFSFTGKVETPEIVYLMTDKTQSAFTQLFLENSKLKVTGTLDSGSNEIRTTGTPANDARNAFQQLMQDETRAPQSEEAFEALLAETIGRNRDNIFGIYLFAQQAYSLPARQILDEAALFSEELQQNKTLERICKTAEQQLKTEVGQPYIDIVQPDADGNPISLRSVVENPDNKYVLVDFWASWCGPCMREVPYLVESYERFGKKGFEIYGISFDRSKEAWINAVGSKGMKWIQVSELNRFDNQAARDYAVQAIPTNLLVSTADGKIVARNLRGDELQHKLEELLGE